jgi:hypothetical protein
MISSRKNYEMAHIFHGTILTVGPSSDLHALHIPFRLTKLDFCGADDEKREYISQSLNFTASRAK